MTPARVSAASLWTPDAGAPDVSLLPTRLRRRTSSLTRIAASVLAELADAGGFQVADVAIVYASALGEIDTTVRLFAMMHEDDGVLSPTRFHNSVHNTAAGYLSIATENRGFSTTLAAGPSTVAAAMIEALALLGDGRSDVVVLMADEPVPEELRARSSYPGIGAGLHLTSRPDAVLLATLAGLRRARGQPAAVLAPDAGASPCAPAAALVRACRGRNATTVALEHGAAAGWCLDVTPRST